MPREPADHELVVIARKAMNEAQRNILSPSVPKESPEGAKQLEGEQLDPHNVIERQRGLTVLVLRAGDTKQAALDLQSQGFEIDQTTLRDWKREYKEEYDELSERLKSEIEESIIRGLRETVVMAESAERKAVEIALAELRRAEKQQNLRPADAAITANNLANIKSKSIDRLLTLTGRPSSIVESRDAETLLRKLQLSGVMKVNKGQDDGT